MRKLEDIEVKYRFPVVMWGGEDLDTASEPAELYRFSPAVAKMYAHHKPGHYHLVDAVGKHYDIDGWEQIEPFGGMKFWFERLFGLVFMVPIVSGERQLTVDEFKRLLEAAARERYRYDEEGYAYADIKAKLPQAKSFAEVIGALPDFT